MSSFCAFVVLSFVKQVNVSWETVWNVKEKTIDESNKTKMVNFIFNVQEYQNLALDIVLLKCLFKNSTIFVTLQGIENLS